MSPGLGTCSYNSIASPHLLALYNSSARPTIELHGYYRVRSQLFSHFALGRKDTPANAMWPQPADNDYIDSADFPSEWWGWPLTVEVEAKAKELAVLRLLADLEGRRETSR